MLSNEIISESTVSISDLFTNYTRQFLKPFEKVVSPDLNKGMSLDFELSDRVHKHKISPILRLARVEDAEEITEIYSKLYEGTYPYKEMEDVRAVREMILDPNIQWIIYQNPSYCIVGCITFVLDFKNKRGYIRGFMLKNRFQGKIDITKAMIGSMLAMLYKYRDAIYVWYVENRTAHAKSQYSMWVCGIAPIAFYPNKDNFLGKVESDLMQICYDERALREYRDKEIPAILSQAERCYLYSDKRYNLGKYRIETPIINLQHEKISQLKKKLKRNVIKDEFGYEKITFSFKNSNSYFEFLYTPQVQNFEKTNYVVKNIEELFVFVQEFIKYGRRLRIRYCEAFISAYKPFHQKIFHDAGLRIRGYLPSWEFDNHDEVFRDCILFNWFEGEISEDIQLIDEGKELFDLLELKLTCEAFRVIKREKSHEVKTRRNNITTIQKPVKISLSIGVLAYLSMIFLSGMIAFISEPIEYYPWKHTISDLGSYSFTPIPFLFDTACFLAGMISIPFYYLLRKKFIKLVQLKEEKKRPHLFEELLKFGTLLGIIGGLGYMLVGVFSIERAGPYNIYHNSFAVFAFSGFVISIACYSTYIIFYQTMLPRSYGVFGFLGPLLLFGLYCVLVTPLVEWLLLISILMFNVPLSFWVFLK